MTTESTIYPGLEHFPIRPPEMIDPADTIAPTPAEPAEPAEPDGDLDLRLVTLGLVDRAALIGNIRLSFPSALRIELVFDADTPKPAIVSMLAAQRNGNAVADDALRSVREAFGRDDASMVKVRQLRQRHSETRAAIDQANAAAEQALTDARKALVEDRDPAAAEKAAREARIHSEVLANRLTAIQTLTADAETEAKTALRSAIIAERERVCAEATAKKDALLDEVTAFLAPRLPELSRLLGIVQATGPTLEDRTPWGSPLVARFSETLPS